MLNVTDGRTDLVTNGCKSLSCYSQVKTTGLTWRGISVPACSGRTSCGRPPVLGKPSSPSQTEASRQSRINGNFHSFFVFSRGSISDYSPCHRLTGSLTHQNSSLLAWCNPIKHKAWQSKISRLLGIWPCFYFDGFPEDGPRPGRATV